MVDAGAQQQAAIVRLCSNKKVGLVANHASLVMHEHSATPRYTHLLDTLLKQSVQVTRLFSPEHGLRGQHDAGAKVKDEVDAKTQLPIISLYGQKKQPSSADMAGLDIILFDLPDMGVRFYTYISTLEYMMRACAASGAKLVVLDRLCYNRNVVDGPLADTSKYRSFISRMPVPVCYGLSHGEYAVMLLGEKWVPKCELEVIPVTKRVKDIPFNMAYSFFIAPSPNIKNFQAARFYPSLCFFEGTNLSIGRGTQHPFLCYGGPNPALGEDKFTPVSMPGATKPVHLNTLCYGKIYFDFTYAAQKQPWHTQLDLKPILDAWQVSKEDTAFWNKRFFNLLAGNGQLQQQIEKGLTEEEIRITWQKDLRTYQKLRMKYVIYNDKTYEQWLKAFY